MNRHRMGQWLVALQFGLLALMAAACAWLASQGRWPGWASHALWVASALLGLWTLAVNRPGNFNIHPQPRANGQLVQGGPYRWVRHPMYGAVLLLAAGAAVWMPVVAGLLLWLCLLAVLLAKARLEEQWLLQHYPVYAAYRQHTWRLLPWVY